MSPLAPKPTPLSLQNDPFSYRSREPDNLCAFVSPPQRADARGVILTGYAAIATAVTAVKLGAFDYLAKPANADDVVQALMAGRLDSPHDHDPPMSADRVRWEHIQRIFEACDRNISETARQLNMHRRTLQRRLAKRAPK